MFMNLYFYNHLFIIIVFALYFNVIIIINLLKFKVIISLLELLMFINLLLLSSIDLYLYFICISLSSFLL